MDSTIKEYMEKNGLKSKQTVYNYEKDGKIRIVKKGKNIFVQEINQEIKIDSDNNLELTKKIEFLEKELFNAKNNILRLELELKNSNVRIKEKDDVIRILEETLKEGNFRYNFLLQQFLELNKNYKLLENKKKKWYQIWK